MKKPPDSRANPRPPAFKNSELGPIPVDWEVRAIGELACVCTGNANTQDKVDTGKYPFYVRSPIVEHIDEYGFDTEGVVTVGDGVGTGKVFHYVNGKFALHQRCYLIDRFCPLLDSKYFYKIFSSRFYDRVMQMTAKSSVDSVRREMITGMLIPVPPLPEQRRIAAALSDADAWIESLEKLIEKKKLVKQGAMQELLTGKTRLPGFGGAEFKRTEIGSIPKDWELKKLGEILTFKNGYNAPSKAYGQGCPFISVLDILEQWPITLDSIRGKVMLNASARNAFSVRDGDLFFMRSSETSEDVGKANVFLGNNGCAVYGGFVIRGRPFVEIDSLFLNYLLKDEAHRKRISANGAGAQHFNIGQTGLAEVEITLPALAEQHAIAEVLSDMDAELASLSREKAKAEQIKQGMMQELLTGRVRLAEGE